MLLRYPIALLTWACSIAIASPLAHATTILHTNDILGELEPCGCRSNPLGGMPRLSNLLKRQSDNLLLLDAGDVLFSADSLPELLQEQSELQASFVIQALNLIHQDAVSPGEKDFALGVKVFDKLRKKAKFKFLAANLKKKNGSAFLPADFIFTRPGQVNTKTKAAGKKTRPLKIGVFGIVGRDLRWPPELKTTDALAAARSEVLKLRKKVDVLIALTHEGYDQDKELAEKVHGIDLIIGGHTQTFLQHGDTIGKTAIFQSSFRNQYVGLIPLHTPVDLTQYQLVGLDAGYDSPAEAPSAMDDLVKEFKQAIAQLNSKQQATIEKNSLPVRDGNEHPKFQTFPKCAECHLKQFEFWRKTNHARALDPLVKQKQALNKECLTCHTVGLGDPEGFKDVTHLAEYKKPKDDNDHEDSPPQPMATDDLNRLLNEVHDAGSYKDKIKLLASDSDAVPMTQALHSLARSWTPVQCENCHQPGRDHPFSSNYSKKVENTVCLSCHTAERAPEWYDSSGHLKEDVLGSKRKLVTCPAGELHGDTGD